MLDELLQIALHLLQVGQIEVHHVAGLVFGVGKVAAVRRVQLEVLDAVVGIVDRTGQVAQAAQDEHAQVGVLANDRSQPARDAGVTVARLEVPRPDAREQLVGQVVLELQFLAQVGVHRRRERPVGGPG